ncbi:MAG TPA: M17 family peptidase N-terminal domain-containing protein, partial [Candidatus Limnocylindrales bacterium]|nr:M17 family peptidase N-terminal domain-containing protein [Candidatus Limnocylindrales bacterium]
MQLRVVTDQPWDVQADVLAIPIVGEPAFEGSLGELDKRTGGELKALAAFGELRAKRFSTSIAASGELPAGRVLTISVGPAEDVDRETVLHVGATAEHRLGGRRVHSLAIWLSPLAEALAAAADTRGAKGTKASKAAAAAETAAELVARGVVEGSFDPKTLYRERDATSSAPPALDQLILVAPGADAGALTRAAERGVIIGEGANHARSLSNRSANDVTPDVLAQEARDVAKKHGLWIDVIEPDRARKLGMGMFLAVGQGSDNPPRMIVMRSGKKGERDGLDRHLAIVGKGVCFDSGGISIKPADRMEEMKMDKIGACTVIAAIATVARLAPGTPLLAVAPAVENMPGS